MKKLSLVAGLLAAAVTAAGANEELPPALSIHMVLQRDMAVPFRTDRCYITE